MNGKANIHGMGYVTPYHQVVLDSDTGGEIRKLRSVMWKVKHHERQDSKDYLISHLPMDGNP